MATPIMMQWTANIMIFVGVAIILFFLIKLYRARAFLQERIAHGWRRRKIIILFIASLFFTFLFFSSLLPFGYGDNVEDVFAGYSLYHDGEWNRCEGGSLDACDHVTLPSYPLLPGFLLSVEFFLFGFPLVFHDAVLFLCIAALLFLVMEVFAWQFDGKGAAFPLALLLILTSSQFSSFFLMKQAVVLEAFLTLASLFCFVQWLGGRDGDAKHVWFSFFLSFAFFTAIARPDALLRLVLTLIFILLFDAPRFIEQAKSYLKQISRFDVLDLCFHLVALLFAGIISLQIANMHMHSGFTHQGELPLLTHLHAYVQTMLQPYNLVIFSLALASFFLIRMWRKRSSGDAHERHLRRLQYAIGFWFLASVATAILFPGDPTDIPFRYLFASFIALLILAQISGSLLLQKLFGAKLQFRIAHVLVALLLILFVAGFSLQLISVRNEGKSQYGDFQDLHELTSSLPDDAVLFTVRTIHMRFLLLDGKRAYSIFYDPDPSVWVDPDAEAYFLYDKQMCGTQGAYIDVVVLYPLCTSFMEENEASMTLVGENDHFKLYDLSAPLHELVQQEASPGS